jgi:orotidine-5'-phosphate decarboxylase
VNAVGDTDDPTSPVRIGLYEQLQRGIAVSGASLCVGLDPDPHRFPDGIGTGPEAIERFCTEIVRATGDLVCAFKPQIAYFAANRAEEQLERICSLIRDEFPHALLILDAKRGDIGSTAEQYAREAFGRYRAHAVTVNPYLGTDAAQPFLEAGGVIALCRTSNSGAGELQDLEIDGRPFYLRVAEMVGQHWTRYGQCGLVVGATAPAELARVRDVCPDLPILLPGIGAQGGDLEASIAAANGGLIISSSRQILYASSTSDFAEAAQREASALRDAIIDAETVARSA